MISFAPVSSAVFRPRSLDDCLGRLQRYFDGLAPEWDARKRRNEGYHRMLAEEYRFHIPPGQRVLEVGCGTGDLLAALEPSEGVGVDLSPEMVSIANRKFPDGHLTFHASPIETTDLGDRTFDYVVLSDLIGFLYDIRRVLEQLRAYCHPRTRLVMNFHSRLWQPAFTAAEKLRLRMPQPVLNWVTVEDAENMLHLAGFEVVRTLRRIMVPKRVPLLAKFCNRFLAPIWPLGHLCVANVVVARPVLPPFSDNSPVVSVLVPCRNEAGNIEDIVRRLPDMGDHTELIFVEGGSSDHTWDECQRVRREHPHRDIAVIRQPGRGKGDAVRAGFAQATGDVLMILDADMTVPPENLRDFYEALMSGRVEFVNGSRLVYPMEGKAMRFLNLCGNKFFAWAFTYLIEQRVKDTLCGTKVLTRDDYERIAAGRDYFGDFDPFGDFDLLFGAAKLNLKIRDLPIRYRDRTYGTTNISRFRHGLLLLRMCGLALRKLKWR